jgi:8-oxo-dGTP diphosphatase
VDDLPGLYLDHERIIRAARERLAAKLEYSTIAFQLMPEYFTLSELQQVYETICDRSIDKRNFRKRVLALEDVVPTERMRRNGSHRPARLYRYTARDAIHYLK